MMAPMIPNILVVDDEEEIRKILAQIIESEGFKALLAADGNEAMHMFCITEPDLVLLDVRMPGQDGMELLKKIKDMDSDLPVVLVTAFANIHQAVEAMKMGAHDYLAKPFDNYEVVRVVHRALREGELKKRLKTALDKLGGNDDSKKSLFELMGPSDRVMRLVTDVNLVAPSNFAVVVTGETGSGKELVARAIHQASTRAGEPFVPVDCGSIPENLLESELFGHEKGSFTGAEVQKKGKFEIAQKGTLFMDEVANMPLGSQAKFLRVLQDKQLYRVGATKPIEIDIRIITATNQNLLEMTAGGLFRQDLFYRLNEFTIHVPPLRDRREDILYLAKRFLDKANIELGKDVRGFTDDAIELILAYNWPGNVRQLRAAIRTADLAAKDIITKNDLNLNRTTAPGFALTPIVNRLPWKNASLGEIVSQSTVAVEREVIKKTLQHTGGNKAKAARLLQIDYKTMHTKVKKYGISWEGVNYEESEKGK